MVQRLCSTKQEERQGDTAGDISTETEPEGSRGNPSGFCAAPPSPTRLGQRSQRRPIRFYRPARVFSRCAIWTQYFSSAYSARTPWLLATHVDTRLIGWKSRQAFWCAARGGQQGRGARAVRGQSQGCKGESDVSMVFSSALHTTSRMRLTCPGLLFHLLRFRPWHRPHSILLCT